MYRYILGWAFLFANTGYIIEEHKDCAYLHALFTGDELCACVWCPSKSCRQDRFGLPARETLVRQTELKQTDSPVMAFLADAHEEAVQSRSIDK